MARIDAEMYWVEYDTIVLETRGYYILSIEGEHITFHKSTVELDEEEKIVAIERTIAEDHGLI